MKLIAYLLMTACLILGTVAATTAYLPRLDLPDEKLVGLTLNADAGLTLSDGFVAPKPDALVRELIEIRDDHERIEAAKIAAPGLPLWDEELDDAALADRIAAPLATQDAEITPELLAALRAQGVVRVRVKEFGVGRWEHAWLMLVACAGLIFAAFLVKAQTRREIAAKLESPAAATETPEHALAEVSRTLDDLAVRLPGLPSDQARNEAVIESVGGLQWTHLQAIIDARPTIIARLKLSGFAAFMDRFSAFERQLNRAWSAAADGVHGESATALDTARALMPEVEAALAGRPAT